MRGSALGPGGRGNFLRVHAIRARKTTTEETTRISRALRVMAIVDEREGLRTTT